APIDLDCRQAILLWLGHHQNVVADDTHRVGADAPFRLDCGGAGRQFETPLVPRTVDVLQIPHHDSVTGRRLVHNGASPGTPRAERAALVRAVVRDGVEIPVDVVDADAVASDRHQFVSAGRDFVYCRDNVFAALGETGLGPRRGCPLIFSRQFRAPGSDP